MIKHLELCQILQGHHKTLQSINKLQDAIFNKKVFSLV